MDTIKQGAILALPIMAGAVIMACSDKGGDTGNGNVVSEGLGTYATDTGGLTGPVEFTVPDGASSAIAWCGAFGDSKLGTVWTLSEAGSPVYTYEGGGAGFRFENTDDIVGVLVPMSPDHDISAGAWGADIWIPTGGSSVSVDCQALYRVEPAGSNATVDLQLVFVGGDLDAASAPDDATLTSILEKVDALWATGGLGVGHVSYADFSGSVDKYTVVDKDSERNDLFRMADPPDLRTLTVFMVDEITDGTGTVILGTAAGPPGIPGGGTSKGGMVVTAGDLAENADSVARVIAHEGAHFLGLFHTSEYSQTDGVQLHDPISGTPQCTMASDDNGDGKLTPPECEGKGAENLMFPLDWSGIEGLEADQGWVLRRNPVAR